MAWVLAIALCMHRAASSDGFHRGAGAGGPGNRHGGTG